MYNHIGVMGRMVSDPELKTTRSGTSVTSFRVAVPSLVVGLLTMLIGGRQ